MANAATDLWGFGEAVVFLNLFSDLPPRQADKGLYLLWETRDVCRHCRFGQKKLDSLLRRIRPRDGTPSHGHLGDIFATPDAEKFRRCFVA